MTIIQAKDFRFRNDLENYVRNKFGLTPDPKIELVIQGTEQELKRLFLGNRSVFWGIRCIVVNKQGIEVLPKAKTEDKLSRGKQTDFGINARDKKIPK